MPSRLDLVASPGKNLRRVREGLGLKYRDVEEAAQLIAVHQKNQEFCVGLSRLADIENKGTVPSIYRLYSLAAVYGLNYSELLGLYGVCLSKLPADAAELHLEVTRPIDAYFAGREAVSVPLQLLSATDFRKTTFISRQMQAWGKLPLQLLDKVDLRHHRYALVGTEDWSMFPLLPPGSFVQIDQSSRKVVNGGWENDFSRPIYFLELRHGYRFGWCTERNGTMIVQPHPSSPQVAEAFAHPEEIEVVGQVVAVAMRFDQVKQRRKRSS